MHLNTASQLPPKCNRSPRLPEAVCRKDDNSSVLPCHCLAVYITTYFLLEPNSAPARCTFHQGASSVRAWMPQNGLSASESQGFWESLCSSEYSPGAPILWCTLRQCVIGSPRKAITVSPALSIARGSSKFLNSGLSDSGQAVGST